MPTETFTKLESRIIGSTIWAEDDHTRILWITMLALADRNGYVGASIPGLAGFARIPLESVERAIEKFLLPDKYSRSQEFEGRRIEVAERGWTLLNYARIRGFRDDEERRAYEAHRKKEYRDRLKVRDTAGQSHDVPTGPGMSAQAEGEADYRSRSKASSSKNGLPESKASSSSKRAPRKEL